MVFRFWNVLTKILPISSKGLSDAKTQWFAGHLVLALPDIKLNPTALHACSALLNLVFNFHMFQVLAETVVAHFSIWMQP